MIGGEPNADQDVVERRCVAAAFEQQPRAGVAHGATRILRDLIELAEILSGHAREGDAFEANAQHVEPLTDDTASQIRRKRRSSDGAAHFVVAGNVTHRWGERIFCVRRLSRDR